MGQDTSGKPLINRDANTGDAQRIDSLYGLEPVIDFNTADDQGGNSCGVQLYPVECPYCGERFETPVDTSSGSTRYIEDCQICCQPIDFSLQVDHEGELQGLSALRCD